MMRHSGQFDTPLIRFAGDKLVVNAAVRPRGTVRVGLLDADGQPITGRGVAECRTLADDNESWTVSWADGHSVSRWSQQSIRLRIELRDADLFGFQFQANS